MPTTKQPQKQPKSAAKAPAGTRPARADHTLDGNELSRSVGNRAVARLLGSPTPPPSIQTKLRVSAPGDEAEAEAERVAEEVMRMPAAGAGRGEVGARVQMKPSAGAGGVGGGETPAAVGEALRGSGRPLGRETREFMEGRFGLDFGHVRVHTDNAAAASAESVEAEAYTVGHDVVFNRGRYAPESTQGRRLLAHELTHVTQQQAAGRAHLSRQPKVKPKPPKPQKFSVLGTDFQAVTTTTTNAQTNATTNVVTIKAAGKSANGWTFTPAAADTFTATRTPARHEYVHANGTAEALTHKVTVKAPANTAVTVGPVMAVLGDPPKLSFEIKAVSDNIRAAKTKTETLFNASVERLDLATPPTGFTPADGDVIQLGLGGGAYVWSTLKTSAPAGPTTTPATGSTPTTTPAPSTTSPPSTPTPLTTPTPATTTTTTAPTPPAPSGTQAAPGAAATTAQGFYDIGKLTIYKGRLGFTSLAVSDAARAKAITDLTTATDLARRITAEEAAIFKTVSLIEHDFAGLQNYDRGVLSFGIAQWTVHSDLPRLLAKAPKDVFDKYLGQYGLKTGPPNRALDATVAKFVAAGKTRQSLGVRNTSEGGLFLNGKDVVTDALLKEAKRLVPIFDGHVKTATAAKADLSSTDAKKVAAAKKQLTATFQALKGLKGTKSRPNRDVALFADEVIQAAAAAHAAAKDVEDNAVSEEELRKPEWVLRFELFGQDPAAQDAQIKQSRETLNKVLAFTISGAAYSQLLRSKRARAALLSSYFNNPEGTKNGVERTVNQFRNKKKAEAQKAAAAAAAAARNAGQPAPKPTPPTEADWAAFPWPAGDIRWPFYTGAAVEEFEAIAIIEMTSKTTDPARRRGFINAIP